jgi:hypothetical protein
LEGKNDSNVVVPEIIITARENRTFSQHLFGKILERNGPILSFREMAGKMAPVDFIMK